MRDQPPNQEGPRRRPADTSLDSKSITNVVFTPALPLLAMTNSLIDDGISTTPVGHKIAAARIANNLRQLYRQRRDELLAAARMFSGFAGRS